MIFQRKIGFDNDMYIEKQSEQILTETQGAAAVCEPVVGGSCSCCEIPSKNEPTLPPQQLKTTVSRTSWPSSG